MIKTERLKIRPLSLSDDSFILELLNSEGWIKYIGDRKIRTLEEAKSYIIDIINKTSVQYNVIEKLNASIPIGILSFIKRDYLNFPDFGFALLPKYYQNGFAKEASIGYLKDLFNKQPKLNIAAICKSNNEPSIKLLEKIGFNYKYDAEIEGDQLRVYDLIKENFMNV